VRINGSGGGGGGGGGGEISAVVRVNTWHPVTMVDHDDGLLQLRGKEGKRPIGFRVCY